MILLMVGVGGFAGAYARFRFAAWVYAHTGDSFPWGTLAINVTGSLLLGLLLPVLELREPLTPLSALVTVGVLGSFTTFSSFAYEAALLIGQRRRLHAAAYVIASLGLGLLAITLGLLAGQALF